MWKNKTSFFRTYLPQSTHNMRMYNEGKGEKEMLSVGFLSVTDFIARIPDGKNVRNFWSCVFVCVSFALQRF